ncbi:Protein 5NUC [Tetrabaena socialis]|uniref:Protein 5NUC n=1 Tax=Tetrabaena socialis TaxID=47790 RepID=A0A2J8AH67_9CHLO|nr:Protein 5NUC [Tetrabaena socialis]|eukprot:PNH11874.1 Protein 5NUC [Tetrabaena socialis]
MTPCGGPQVAVLGYVTTDTASLASSGAVRFSEVVSSMQRCVGELRAAEPDVNIIIALGHAGYLVDMDVAARVPGIDLVIGGHSHTFLYGPTGQEAGPPLVASNPASGEPSMGPYPTFVTGPSGRRVPVVQAAFYSKYVGSLNLTFSAAGDLLALSGQPQLMGGAASSSPITRDPGVLALIDQLAGPVRAMQGSVIGSLAANLTADRAVVRAAEAPLGNLVCDAMLWYIRVSGLRFTFSPAAPKNQRVLAVEVAVPGPDGGPPTYAPLDPCRYYTLVTNNYMSDGGDSYTSFKAAATLYGNGPAMDLSVVQYITAFSPVPGYTAPEGRITRCAAPPPAGSSPDLPPPPASCSAVRAFGGCALSMQLLHFNDLHNRIESATSSGAACNAATEASGVCFGGMARLAAAIKASRANALPTLVLDAGDESVGTMWDVVYNDRRPTAAAQNALALDAFTLGNHEFDFGVASLVSYISRVNAPVLACNLDASSKPDLATRVRPYTVVEVGATGVRGAAAQVGVVGWVTPDTAFTSKVASDLQVAQQVPGIDLIVGAHDHYFLYGNGTTPGPLLVASDPRSGQMPYREYPVLATNPGGQSVPIVQAYYASRYLGAIALDFSDAGSLTGWAPRPQLLGGNVSSSAVAQDASMLSLIAQYSAPLGSLSSDVLGYTPVPLSGDRSLTRVREAPLGNLLCDAMLWYLANSTALPGDVCITNGGGLRADIAAGNITTAEVAGLEYAYDDTAPVGSRIVAAAIRTRAGPVPLDPCATYALATNDFMAAGGDTYTVLTRAGVLFAAGPPLADILMAYIQAFSPLQAHVGLAL